MSFEGYAVAGLIGFWDTTILDDHKGIGIWDFGTVGEDVLVGKVLCMKADGKWWKTRNDDVASMPGAVLALEDKSSGETCKILRYGVFRDDSWGWTAGSRLFCSSTPGDMTHARPIGKYKQYQAVAKALTAHIIHFNPCVLEHKETPFCGGCSTLLDAGYASINGVQPITDNPDKSYIGLPYAGVLRDLRVRLTSLPGAGNSWTLTIWKAWEDTALACTISDAEAFGEDTVNEVALGVDDRICMHITKFEAPVPTFASWSAHFYRS